jgi:hypothetical protein
MLATHVTVERTDLPLSAVLASVACAIPPEGMTLRELLVRMGDRGLLMLCMMATIPFLLPVSIPGSSTPFGLIVAFIAIGLVADRPPWLPRRLLDHRVAPERLHAMLDRGTRFFARLERLAHPRVLALTHGKTVGRWNGILLFASAVALMAPLPLPLTNTIPAWAILFLAAGSLERDGFFVLAGYVCVVLEGVYFSSVGILGVSGVRNLVHHIAGVSSGS